MKEFFRIVFQGIYLEYSLHVVSSTQNLCDNCPGLFATRYQRGFGLNARYLYNHPLSIPSWKSDVTKQPEYYGI